MSRPLNVQNKKDVTHLVERAISCQMFGSVLTVGFVFAGCELDFCRRFGSAVSEKVRCKLPDAIPIRTMR